MTTFLNNREISKTMQAYKRYSKLLTQSASRYRNIIINTLGGTCVDCGIKTGDLIIHHKKYEIGMTIKDVELVCQICHKKRHLTRDISKRIEDFLKYIKSFNKEKVFFAEIQMYAARGTLLKYINILESKNKLKYNETKPRSKGYIQITQGDDTT